MVSSATSKGLLSRRPLRLALIIFLVLILLGLLLLFTPRYLARYLLASQLDELHIDHSGIETLTINPFTRELWFGPVRIGGRESEAARLEELGLTLGYNPLLHRQIYIERLILRGIDLTVLRDKESHYFLNGIPLDRFLVPAKEEVPPTAEGEPWKPGVGDLELRDSRLIFQDRGRGELAVQVERLSLMDFLGWQPEKPGSFELSARINDILLNWTGEATPFAEDITLAIDSRTEQAELPKIVRFTGPLGLDRRNGLYDASLKHQLTLFRSGGMEGRTRGVIEGKGLDYLHKDLFSLTLDRASGDLDLSYALNASGDFSLRGKLALDLGQNQVRIQDQTQVAMTTGRVVLDSLDAGYANDGNLRIALRPEVDFEKVAFSGPIQISVDRLLDLLAILQSLSAGTQVATSETGLGDFAGSSVAVPNSDVKLGRLHSKGDSLTLQSAGGKLDLAIQTHTNLHNIQVGVEDSEIEVERLESELERLSLVSGQGQLLLDMTGENSLVAGTMNGPGGELKIDSLKSQLNRLTLEVQTGAIALEMAGANRAEGFSGQVYAKESLPEVGLQLGMLSTKIAQAALDLQGEKVQWRAAVDAKADALGMEVAKGEETRMKFGHAEIQGLQADERLQLSADALTIDGLDLTLKRSVLETLFKGNEDKGDKADELEKTEAPKDLAKVQTLLIELGYDPGSVDGRMGQRTATAIKAFQKKAGITVDGRMSSGLLAALEHRAAGADADSEVPDLQIGKLALQGDPVIRFHDDIVEPPVKINTVLKELQIQNLSTRKREPQTEFRLAAVINEFTKLAVEGWTKGLHRNADMNMDVRLNNLELSTYSPYVTKLAGVHLNSGQLDTQVTGKATGGILQGRIQLDLDHMEFEPLNEEEAARMAETMGMPLELAANLLEDGNGHIALKLPVGGTLLKPDVDISSAVSKAIGGVLKRVFPPTLAVSLLSKIAKGGAPSFEPILFTPGSADLDETGRRYTDEIAKFLKEHPKLSLKLCGRSTAQDLAQLSPAEKEIKTAPEQTPPASGVKDAPLGQSELPVATQEALKELALARKSVVRVYLIETKGIDTKRVPECRSKFSADDPGNPRVEIMF